jgi:hypothetical protein
MLKDSGLLTYDRSGKTTGVVLNNYKFRFSRLGYTDEKINELAISESREQKLKEFKLHGNKLTLER